jgi:hypothetical protein
MIEVQCSTCLKLQDIPEPYEGKEIKCQICKKMFTASAYEPPPQPEHTDIIPETTLNPPVTNSLSPIICPNPNCGYKGFPKRESRGDVLIGLVLCLFFLLPGILYFMFKSGYRYNCPKCGMQISSDL